MTPEYIPLPWVHPVTILALMSLLAGGIGLGFVAAWLDRRRPDLGYWALSYLIDCIGSALLMLALLYGNDPLQALACHLLLLAAMALRVAGVLSYRHRPISWLLLGSGLLLWLVLCLLLFATPPDPLRAAGTFQTLIAVYLAWSAQLLWQLGKGSPRAGAYLLGATSVLWLLFGIANLVGPICLMLFPMEVRYGLMLALLACYTAYSFILFALASEQANAKLRRDALHDPLTGALTRREFLHQADVLRQRLLRQNQSLSILMLDLDRLKPVNDRWGHATGDRLLTEFARTVRKALRERDIFARVGGEEFAVLLPGASISTARNVAERIRRTFVETMVQSPQGERITTTVSIGVYSQAPPQDDIQSLLDRADQALYQAKRNGRNQVAT